MVDFFVNNLARKCNLISFYIDFFGKAKEKIKFE
jgi:hypothetical protein